MKIGLFKLFWKNKAKERQIRPSEMSHEKQKKEAQICRRWFISTRMYIGKCDFWVVARKAEKRGPNSPPLIYFHAQVYWKIWLLSSRTKSRKKRPKFAAVDLFSRASIENRFSMAVFTNFAATLATALIFNFFDK